MPQKKITDPQSQIDYAISMMVGCTEAKSQITKELEESALAISNGNLEEVEQLLLSQSKLLNTLGTQLTIKGYHLISESAILATMPQLPTNLVKLGLRSLEQSRKTLKTLADIKHPKRTTFVKQQLNQVNVAPQLGESTNAEMDKRSQRTAEAEVPEAETLEA